MSGTIKQKGVMTAKVFQFYITDPVLAAKELLGVELKGARAEALRGYWFDCDKRLFFVEVMWLNQARGFLWDPNWRGEFAPGVLRKLDAAFKAGAMEVSQIEGEELTDLVSDDPVKGEYPRIGGRS
jgi:hypothetical protein